MKHEMDHRICIRIKPLLAAVLVICIFGIFTFTAYAKTPDSENKNEQWPKAPEIMAESGIVMEASTGTILYEKDSEAQHYPASITKIMTALLAIENCKMDEIVTVPHEAVYMEDKGTHIALDEGEQLTVEQCLYAVMLASANDAAYALAVHVGKTIENFVDMMNEKAEEIGCKNTNFTNPHGLPDEAHLTTAYDMALITKEALKYDSYRTVSGTLYYEIPASEHQKDLIQMYHHHKMLGKGTYYYESAFSGKNGYTVAAQNTLVTCAQKDGMELICVTMKTEGRQVYLDTADLLDYGFDQFQKLNISENEKNYNKIPEAADEKDSGGLLKVQIDKNSSVVIPKNVGFADLEAELNYGKSKSGELPEVSLSYSYQGHKVGAADLTWLESKTESEKAEKTDQSGNEKESTETKGPDQKQNRSAFWIEVWKDYHFWIIGAAVLAAGILAGVLIYRKIRGDRDEFK